ncbi:helix-turn-helix domain-containing protein [Streptomyces lonarensis]|uniref:Helix-turn-helix transcriptional regulator n=1 Tax=Streptomyces lonarensis TaxID=700599 RepID=A0A7X6CY71_9ACTN|nr:helix-turn-helix transcriptional regulator [Streptomyces lonarensis]NJQ04598.1 helix-turn-helix transcriptional regulator [Streptomyces lonarensis]
MPPRALPTQRQRRLGAEVRKMRTDAGLTAEYVAGLIGVDRAKVSNIETGARNLSADRLRTLAAHCDLADDDYLAALIALTEQPGPRWWDEYRGRLSPGLQDLAELEWEAKRIQTIQTVHVPGLLQTADYARSIFASVLPRLSPLEVELRVAHRVARQQVLQRPEPPPYVGYVHEAALRMRFGGTEIMRQQLLALCEAGDRPAVTLRVIPVERGAFPGAGSAILFAEGAVPQLDTVQLDAAHGSVFLHAEAQLAKYRAHVTWMDESSLAPGASQQCISGILRDL